MKSCSLMLLIALAATPLGAGKNADSKATAAFEKLKSLAGEWEAHAQWDGKPVDQPVHMSYRVMSKGSSLVQVDHEENTAMVSVYHLDGDRLMLTHYCSANNQPRLRAEPPQGEPRSLTFNFADITNLAGTDEGHMHKMVLTFEDNDHITQEWTWKEGQKEYKAVFRFERKK